MKTGTPGTEFNPSSNGSGSNGSGANGSRERRRAPRESATRVGYLKARLMGGPEVTLKDVSRRGVLLETESRLLPGVVVGIRFLAADATLTMRGCVVRSSVAHLTGSALKYHTALAFDDELTLYERTLTTGPPDAPDARDEEITLITPVPQTGKQLRTLLSA
jgi:hypothetical protein